MDLKTVNAICKTKNVYQLIMHLVKYPKANYIMA